MPANDRPTFALTDGEGLRLHASWSRSGRRLILTIFDRAPDGLLQVELTPIQVGLLADYLALAAD